MANTKIDLFRQVTGTRTSTGMILDIGDNTIVTTRVPETGTELANKTYVDNIAAGLDPKASVDYATKADLPTNVPSGSGVGKTITLTGLTTWSPDGTAVVNTERILVKNYGASGSENTSSVHNGIYVISGVGSEIVLTRATDFDGSPDHEVSGGNFTFVEKGTDLAETGWVVLSNGQIDVDTDPIAWTQFSGAGSFTAGNGIEINAGVIAVDLNTTNALDFVNGDLELNSTILGARTFTTTAGTAGAFVVNSGADGINLNCGTSAGDIAITAGSATGGDVNITAVNGEVNIQAGTSTSLVKLTSTQTTITTGNVLTTQSTSAFTVAASTGSQPATALTVSSNASVGVVISAGSAADTTITTKTSGIALVAATTANSGITMTAGSSGVGADNGNIQVLPSAINITAGSTLNQGVNITAQGSGGITAIAGVGTAANQSKITLSSSSAGIGITVGSSTGGSVVITAGSAGHTFTMGSDVTLTANTANVNIIASSSSNSVNITAGTGSGSVNINAGTGAGGTGTVNISAGTGGNGVQLSIVGTSRGINVTVTGETLDANPTAPNWAGNAGAGSLQIATIDTVQDAFNDAVGTIPTFVDQEAVSGTKDGSNPTFTIATAPSPTASLHLYLNGILQVYSDDYTLSGSTITMVGDAIPESGDSLVASYRY